MTTSDEDGRPPGSGDATGSSPEPTEPPELTVLGRIPSGSNAVFRCADAVGAHWVYKPVMGESPLADFPDGTLAAREVAAAVVSDALGWSLVPETVWATGPGGPGMAQRWIDVATDAGPDPVDLHPADAVPAGRVAVLRGEDDEGADVVVAHSVTERVRRIALFDHVINNADRKGGHLLRDTAGEVWAIDHGLAFHHAPKLRTVLWGWAGRPLDPADLDGLRGLGDRLADPDSATSTALSGLLAEVEVAALRARLAALVEAGVFPTPGPGYPLPWPLF